MGSSAFEGDLWTGSSDSELVERIRSRYFDILINLDLVPCPFLGLDMACGEDTGKLGYMFGGWKLNVISHSSLNGDPHAKF